MVKLLKVGNGRKAQCNVKDRLCAMKIMSAIEDRFRNFTPAERNSPFARRLRLVYVLAITTHLPKTQAVPYISMVGRESFDVGACDATLFEHTFTSLRQSLHDWFFADSLRQ